MNSFKSACSFAKSTPVPLQQFEKHVEPLLRRQLRVELIVGAIRIFKTAKDLNESIHVPNCSMPRAAAERERPISLSRHSLT